MYNAECLWDISWILHDNWEIPAQRTPRYVTIDRDDNLEEDESMTRRWAAAHEYASAIKRIIDTAIERTGL